MKVYLVQEWDDTIVDIFATEELANQYVASLDRKPGFSLSVAEWVVIEDI